MFICVVVVDLDYYQDSGLVFLLIVVVLLSLFDILRTLEKCFSSIHRFYLLSAFVQDGAERDRLINELSL